MASSNSSRSPLWSTFTSIASFLASASLGPDRPQSPVWSPEYSPPTSPYAHRNTPGSPWYQALDGTIHPDESVSCNSSPASPSRETSPGYSGHGGYGGPALSIRPFRPLEEEFDSDDNDDDGTSTVVPGPTQRMTPSSTIVAGPPVTAPAGYLNLANSNGWRSPSHVSDAGSTQVSQASHVSQTSQTSQATQDSFYSLSNLPPTSPHRHITAASVRCQAAAIPTHISPHRGGYPHHFNNGEKLPLSNSPPLIEPPLTSPGNPPWTPSDNSPPGPARIFTNRWDRSTPEVGYHDPTKDFYVKRDGTVSRNRPFSVAEYRPRSRGKGSVGFVVVEEEEEVIELGEQMGRLGWGV